MPEGARWISRVPSTLTAAKTLYTEVGEDAMVDTDEDTRYAEFGTYYGGVRQRWLLVLHEPTRKKRDETLEKRVEKEREQAKKDLWHLENEEYACEDALERDLEALKKKWRYHDVSGEVHIEKRYEQSGRPTDDTPYHPVWRFEGQVVADEEHLERLRQRHGKYIIATNELDETCLSSQKMLAIYKEQSTSVERGFRFLKDPMFFAHSLFLKKPSRIMALLMIMGLSLLVYALGERRLRAELVARNETIPDQKGQPTQRPTLRRIFQMLEGIDALYIEKSGSRQRLILNMTDLRRQILNLFGPAVQILYDLPT
jgi:transposase